MKAEKKKRVLDPVDRVSEIVFGLIMALTFTCTLSVATAGQHEIRSMMTGALGCNLAWGLVDAFMFLIANFTERGRGLRLLHSIQRERDARAAAKILRDALAPVLSEALKAAQVESLREGLCAMKDVPLRSRLTKEDWLGALAIFIVVFASTFPVVIPFAVMKLPEAALRTSNAIAVAMLFAGGVALGRQGAHRPWLMGLAMALVGSVLVGITIALGG